MQMWWYALREQHLQAVRALPNQSMEELHGQPSELAIMLTIMIYSFSREAERYCITATMAAFINQQIQEAHLVTSVRESQLNNTTGWVLLHLRQIIYMPVRRITEQTAGRPERGRR